MMNHYALGVTDKLARPAVPPPPLGPQACPISSNSGPHPRKPPQLTRLTPPDLALPHGTTPDLALRHGTGQNKHGQSH